KFMGTARVTFLINEEGIIEEIIQKVNTKDHTAQILKDAEGTTAPVKKPAAKKTTAKKTPAKKAVAAKKVSAKKKS
ncbi:MAG TPA: hypothetical protein VIN08_10840, partial [Ohtaekwangia sp.]